MRIGIAGVIEEIGDIYVCEGERHDAGSDSGVINNGYLHQTHVKYRVRICKSLHRVHYLMKIVQ